MKAPDLHKRENEIGMKLVVVVKQASIRRVVFLSGASAHLRERAGSGLGASMMEELLPNVGSYVAESDFFDEAWRRSFWGPNYARLLAVKDEYDPDGLFFVHHGVGSERWCADGFTRLA